MKRLIVVRTSFEALHRWEDATGDVAFLANDHRHVFMIELKVEVKHNDRELEIIQVKRWLDNFLDDMIDKTLVNHLGTRSCEDIAQAVVVATKQQFGIDRAVSCSVLEDGFLGAEVV